MDDDPIVALLSRYRTRKADRDALDAELDVLKAELEPRVKAIGGKYQDDLGYVRIVTRNPTISYKTDALDALCASFPDIRGKLWPHRRETVSAPYLQIK